MNDDHVETASGSLPSTPPDPLDPAGGSPTSSSTPARASSQLRRTRVVPAVLAGVLIIAAIIFRHPLIAWFTGQSTGGSTSAASSIAAGGLKIATAVQPDPPRENGNVAHVEVHDAQGKAVTGAKVRLEFDMPAMGTMQAMHGGNDATENGEGRYSIPFDLGMTGSWTISIKVTASSGSATARYSLRVGASGLTPLGGDSEGGGDGGAGSKGAMGAMNMGSGPAGSESEGSGSMGSMNMGSGSVTSMNMGSGSAGSGNGSDVAYYTCSMHPAVHSETPGTCPICSMNLTPVTKEAQTAGVIHIDENRRAMLGIRTTKVVQAPIDLEIAAKGRLAVDETRLHEITLKVGGYVSDLKINATGQSVHKGDTLFTLYSPELYAAQQEYLIARSNREALHDAARGDALIQASETKLRLWGLADEQLHAIVERGQPIERIPFKSPASGVVIEKNVIDGAAVTAGARLFKIADLDQIWVEADVYEADLPRIKKDLPATITLTYLPGETFEGKVAFVYPYLDPASRTGRVRIALKNKALELKPDMFATVTFKIPLGPRLMVPSDAVVYTGPRRLVFLDLGKGALRPQEVTIGTRNGDNVEILTGVKEGDVVVSSGNFLVAAESRVRSASGFWGDTDATH